MSSEHRGRAALLTRSPSHSQRDLAEVAPGFHEAQRRLQARDRKGEGAVDDGVEVAAASARLSASKP